MNVIPQRTFHNVMDENPDEEVPEAQRVKGYKYGKTLVRISTLLSWTPFTESLIYTGTVLQNRRRRVKIANRVGIEIDRF